MQLIAEYKVCRAGVIVYAKRHGERLTHSFVKPEHLIVGQLLIRHGSEQHCFNTSLLSCLGIRENISQP